LAGVRVSEISALIVSKARNKARQILQLQCGRSAAEVMIRPHIGKFRFRRCELPLHLQPF
jgi:hypothetical protein